MKNTREQPRYTRGSGRIGQHAEGRKSIQVPWKSQENASTTKGEKSGLAHGTSTNEDLEGGRRRGRRTQISARVLASSSFFLASDSSLS